MKKLPILVSLMLMVFCNNLFSQFKSDNELIGTWVGGDLKHESKWVFFEHNLLRIIDSTGKEQMCAYHLDTLKKDLWVITELPGPDSVRTLLYFKIINESKNSLDIYLYKGSVIHPDKYKQDEDTDLTGRNVVANLRRLY